MPLDPDRDMANEDFEEDDMPPLVDNDNPSPTYTFSPGMTPLSFTSTSASTATRDINLQSSTSLISPPPTSPVTPDESTSTFSMPLAQARPSGKRRDPSYIPRPPNAFILFRCAFIKEQNVPGKVEGNHSKLSKIIGLCWRQLAPEEREKWEAKAIVAQAEHRAHYPDWRFRPGANALVKLKVKDEAGTVSTRRRSVRSRTKEVVAVEEREDDEAIVPEAKGKGKEKIRGKSKSTRPLSIEETRCAKIAGFVAEGIKGEELEVAVKQWEGDHRIPKAVAKPSRPKGRGLSGTSSVSSHVRSHSDMALTTQSFSPAPKEFHPEPSDTPISTPTEASSTLTPNQTHNLSPPESSISTNSDLTSTLPDLPLTHMFKRSLSAPAPNHRHPYPQSSGASESSNDDFPTKSAEPSPEVWGTFEPLEMQEAPTRTHTHVRRDTISFPMPSHQDTTSSDFQHLTWQEAENQRRMEEMQNPDTWWTQKADSPHYAFEENQEHRHSVDLSINNMGYDVPDGGSQFDRGYREQYGPYEIANQDGSQRIEWTDMSTNNRQGLVTVIEDPYQDDCNNNSPSISSPPTLSLPPLSNSGLYYSNQLPVAPPLSFPSSSFSTLTGWAGDYKHHHSEPRAWSNHTPPLSAPPLSGTGWYNTQGSFNWGKTRPQLEHAHLSHDAEDWDRLEHRAASDLGLPVEPPRQLTFDDEIRRLQHRAR